MKNIFLIFLLIITSFISAQNYNDFVYIKGGKFKMGSDTVFDEHKHKVKISSFYVLDHEVTNAEYVKFLNEKGNQHEGNTVWIDINGHWADIKCRIYKKKDKYYVSEGYENYPVTFVSWWGARAYSEWKGGRLPTEAEWEYLAYLSMKKINFDKDSLKKYAFYKENSDYKLHSVKNKKKLLNIYDLFGNLSEWCNDWYSAGYYYKSERKNPKGPTSGDQKVKRGGSWATLLKSINHTNRRATNPNNNNVTIGFRVVIPEKNK